jgi:DNA-binding response OmpR family regulator
MMLRASILVIEDRTDVRSALADLLRIAFPGYAVLESGDGAAGLAAARGHCAVLAIVDATLPDMNGRELVERLRITDPALDALLISHEPASGSIPKDRLHEELLPAIERALALRKRNSH